MSTEKKEFTFPEVNVGDTLQVAFDRSFSRPMLGLVNIVKPNSISAIVFSDRGPVIYPHCRHKDDPWLLDHPWAGENGKAIFEVTSLSSLKQRVGLLENLVAQQAAELASLHEVLRSMPAPTPSRAVKPGRVRDSGIEPMETLKPISA